jgi:hypothetical protein
MFRNLRTAHPTSWRTPAIVGEALQALSLKETLGGRGEK